MELRHLRYFVAVAETLSFTKAAEREMVAQPSLSQQIRELETELEVELFVRSTRRTELSAVGRELLSEARAILRRVDRFQESASRRKRGELGELRIGCISALANARLASLLRAFREANPNLSVGLEVFPSLIQAQALRAGTIDAGFLTLSEDELAGLNSREVYSGPLSMAVPEGHPLSTKDRLEWGDLKGEPLILVEQGAIVAQYYSGFFRRCREAGFEPLVPQHAPNGATQIFMVSAGLGLAPVFLPGSHDEWPGLRVVRLPEDAPCLRVLFVWKLTSPALERFHRLLDSTLPKLMRDGVDQEPSDFVDEGASQEPRGAYDYDRYEDGEDHRRG